MDDWRGKRVVVMGLGRFGGGVGAARFCAGLGADVLVTDLLGEGELRDSLHRLHDLPIRYRLGGHDENDFASADLIVVNPAVDPRRNRFLQAASNAGVGLTTEIELLIDRLPNRFRTIGVTGTAGKSTTTAMIGHILSAALAEQRVHVGGNLGGSMLDRLNLIGAEDWVVLELSSFMLEMLADFSPHIAVVTNLADNHLDRHETLTAYAAAKQILLRHQTAADYAVLGDAVADWAAFTPGTAHVIRHPYAGRLSIPGRHNQVNASYASAAAGLALFNDPHDPRAQTLADFRGLPYRLAYVGQHRGVRFYDDSKSTTADAARLAIDSFEPGRVHVILGGYDKKADLSALARHASGRCAGVYTIGATGPAIADAAQSGGGGAPVERCQTLEVAVKQAVRAAKQGQVVLLSPACASWDQFENYEVRGRLFADLVLRYAANS